MKKEMKLALEIMMEKYCSLVWFARSNPDNEKIQPRIKEVEEQFPEETTRYKNGNSNFEHGFNSGMLAGIRFALSKNLKRANENFPALDT